MSQPAKHAMQTAIDGREQISSDPVKVGVLFSQSGPMALTELALLKGAIVGIGQINSDGGVCGVPVAPVFGDPKSDAEAFNTLARKMILEDRVEAIFGCCSSASRKAVLPIIERHGRLLFYPSVYEGFEFSPNIIYSGSVPNQVVLPLCEYLLSHVGKKFFLVGTESIYAREINRIIKDFLVDSVASSFGEEYIGLGADGQAFRLVAEQVRRTSVEVVISTVVGGDTPKLYQAIRDALPTKVPIASLTTSENELAAMIPAVREGHITAASYFSSIGTPESIEFLTQYRARYGRDEEPGVYSYTVYKQVLLFAHAKRLRETGKYSLSDLIIKIASEEAPSEFSIDRDNNHSFLRPRIARSNYGGIFEIIWDGGETIKPDPYLISYNRNLPKIH
jgi:ABC-type branched-subunit amino acid transport system substrate-binding protein